MSGGRILRPVAGSNGVDMPVEDDCADHVVRGDHEHLADRAYRDLCNDGVVEALCIRRGPCGRLDGLARLDVPERLVLGNDVEGRQKPLNRQQRRLGHVSGVPLGGEPFWIGRSVQHYLHVLADGKPVVIAEASGQLCDVRVARLGPALRLGGSHSPGGLSFPGHALSRGFPLPVIILSASERLLGRLD